MITESMIKALQDEINEAIPSYLPSSRTHPQPLHEAIHYSINAGGKRLRPILLILAHRLFPSDQNPLPAAIAVECLHTYSLIHDDLPCMDNSSLRRGKPTCHMQFSEAIALLAGDALLTHAFQLLSEHYTDNKLTFILAQAAGSKHLIGGQVQDMLSSSSAKNKDTLHFIHQNKTAALISASLEIGLRLGTHYQTYAPQIKHLGYHLGMAFQIIDDILDITSDPDTLGKSSGNDAANDTLTYPAVYGLEASRVEAQNHSNLATQILQEIGGNNQTLLELIHNLEHRIS